MLRIFTDNKEIDSKMNLRFWFVFTSWPQKFPTFSCHFAFRFLFTKSREILREIPLREVARLPQVSSVWSGSQRVRFHKSR